MLFRNLSGFQVLRCVDNEWANLVDIASVRGLNPLTVQLGSMEAGLLCKHLFENHCLQNLLLNPCYIKWTFV
jgi:hypothetical protein